MYLYNNNNITIIQIIEPKPHWKFLFHGKLVCYTTLVKEAKILLVPAKYKIFFVHSTYLDIEKLLLLTSLLQFLTWFRTLIHGFFFKFFVAQNCIKSGSRNMFFYIRKLSLNCGQFCSTALEINTFFF